ncbi:MAG TPA: molybdate ABC transporter permease subunit [Piscirickettsiaceae bacterium]|nr:molybdate ABC transporter permease subunit [Piscirickettsiaceae bacterium]HIQ39670.1 molybdate ABC transporter permease subunit [Sulfurivirga caldicuralii]
MSLLALIDWQSLWLTFKVAALTTLILLLLGTPIALYLAFSRSRLRPIWEAVVALPLVLPPTVLGFYLLMAMAPDSPIGQFYGRLFPDQTLPFSFTGVVIASVCYSLPFAVQPLMHAFEQVGRGPLQAAALLGAPKWAQLFQVLFPLARRGFLLAATLTFAHTVGEFGVILMVGGNIPGVTQVASITIYEQVEALQYDRAHALSLVLLLFSFAALLMVYGLNRRWGGRHG